MSQTTLDFRSSSRFDLSGITLYAGETVKSIAPRYSEKDRYESTCRQIADRINRLAQVPEFKKIALRAGYIGGDKLDIHVNQSGGQRIIGFRKFDEKAPYNTFVIDSSNVKIDTLAKEIIALVGSLHFSGGSDDSGASSSDETTSLSDDLSDRFYEADEESNNEVIQRQRERIEDLDAQLAVLTEKHDRLRSETTATTRALQGDLLLANQEIQDKKSKIAAQSAELAKLHKTIRQLREESDALKAKLAESADIFRRDLAAKIKENAALAAQLKERTEQLATATNTTIPGLEATIARIQSQLNEKTEALTALEAKYALLEKARKEEVERLEGQIEVLGREKDAITKDRDALLKRVEELTQQVEAQRVALVASESKNKALAETNDEQKEALVTSKADLAALRSELEQAQARLQELEIQAKGKEDVSIERDALLKRVEELTLEVEAKNKALAESSLKELERIEAALKKQEEAYRDAQISSQFKSEAHVTALGLTALGLKDVRIRSLQYQNKDKAAALKSSEASVTALRSELEQAQARLKELEAQDAAQKAELEVLRTKAPVVDSDALGEKDRVIAKLHGRVEDLTHELETVRGLDSARIRSLEDELASRPDLDKAIARIAVLESENSHLSESLLEAQAQIAGTRSSFDNDLSSLKAALAHSQKEVADLLQERSAIIGRSVSENITLCHKLRLTTDSLKRVGAQNVSMCLKIEYQEAVILELRDTIAKLKSAHETQLNDFAEEIDRLEKEIAGLKVELGNRKRAIREQSAKIEDLEWNSENDNAIVSYYQEKERSLAQRERAIEREKKVFAETVAELEKMSRFLEDDRDYYRSELEEVQLKLNELQKEHDEMLDKIRLFAREHGVQMLDEEGSDDEIVDYYGEEKSFARERALERINERKFFKKEISGLEKDKIALEAERDDYRIGLEKLRKEHDDLLDIIRRFAEEQGFTLEI